MPAAQLDHASHGAVKFGDGEAMYVLCSSERLPPSGVEWGFAHEAVLRAALCGLGALGGLPQGVEAKTYAAWHAAARSLRSIKTSLASAAVDVRVTDCTDCAPGYAPACKAVREDSVKRACSQLPQRPPAVPAAVTATLYGRNGACMREALRVLQLSRLVQRLQVNFSLTLSLRAVPAPLRRNVD